MILRKKLGSKKKIAPWCIRLVQWLSSLRWLGTAWFNVREPHFSVFYCCVALIFTINSTGVPEILSFTTGSPSQLVGNDIIANCCAQGFPPPPPPVIKINGVTQFVKLTRQIDGNYQGCAVRSLPTTSVAYANRTVTTVCNVTLTPNVTCAMLYENVGELAGDFENCKANITRNTSASERTVLVGKPNPTVHVVLSVLRNATSCSRDIFASPYVWIHFLFANKSDIEKTGKFTPWKVV